MLLHFAGAGSPFWSREGQTRKSKVCPWEGPNFWKGLCVEVTSNPLFLCVFLFFFCWRGEPPDSTTALLLEKHNTKTSIAEKHENVLTHLVLMQGLQTDVVNIVPTKQNNSACYWSLKTSTFVAVIFFWITHTTDRKPGSCWETSEEILLWAWLYCSEPRNMDICPVTKTLFLHSSCASTATNTTTMAINLGVSTGVQPHSIHFPQRNALSCFIYSAPGDWHLSSQQKHSKPKEKERSIWVQRSIFQGKNGILGLNFWTFLLLENIGSSCILRDVCGFCWCLCTLLAPVMKMARPDVRHITKWTRVFSTFSPYFTDQSLKCDWCK